MFRQLKPEDLGYFLSQSNLTTNAWMCDKTMRVYVRKAIRIFGGQRKTTLDVANVIVEDAYRRQGYFKSWIGKAEQTCKFMGVEVVHVENVQNKELEKFLLARGYDYVNRDYYIPSLYKLSSDIEAKT